MKSFCAMCPLRFRIISFIFIAESRLLLCHHNGRGRSLRASIRCWAGRRNRPVVEKSLSRPGGGTGERIRGEWHQDNCECAFPVRDDYHVARCSAKCGGTPRAGLVVGLHSAFAWAGLALRRHMRRAQRDVLAQNCEPPVTTLRPSVFLLPQSNDRSSFQLHPIMFRIVAPSSFSCREYKII
jgi:hypothetical protein